MQFARLVPRMCPYVNRVVYVFGPLVAGPLTEIVPTHLTPDVLDQLRQADDVVNRGLMDNNLIKAISQVEEQQGGREKKKEEEEEEDEDEKEYKTKEGRRLRK